MALEALFRHSTSHPYLTLVILLVLYPLFTIIYALTLHPLSRIPGPLLWRISRIPYLISLVRGTIVHDIEKFHKRYGPILRIAPNEVTFAHAEAYTEIMLPRGGAGGKFFAKDPTWWAPQAGMAHSILTSTDMETHMRFKRILAGGFTSGAVRKQENVVQRYVNLLIERLGEHIGGENDAVEVDVVPWVNFTTFDVIGDLEFGESFDCLQHSRYHPWIAVLFGFVRTASVVAAARFYPWIEWVLMKCIPPSMRETQRQHYQQIVDKVQRRLNWELERPDIMAYAIGREGREKGEEGLTFDQLTSTFSSMTIAGSETTATTVSGTISYLLRYPETRRMLEDEIRGRFEKESDITIEALRNLPYLNAVLTEGLRVCPPVPWVLGRLAPTGGEDVCGTWIPGGAWTLNRDPDHFHEPTSFHPERWLADASTDASSPFFNDRRSAVQPFLIGPHGCIGQNLAWAEMRLILAKLIWTFDIEAAQNKMAEWETFRTFLLVDIQPIVVKMRRRVDVQ